MDAILDDLAEDNVTPEAKYADWRDYELSSELSEADCLAAQG